MWSCWPQEGALQLKRRGQCLGRSLAPVKSDSTAWHGICLAERATQHHGRYSSSLNLTTNITIIDPEHGIRGGHTSCWRRGHLHLTNLTTLQMLCKTPHTPEQKRQGADLTWHTKTGQINTSQFLNLLHDTSSFKSGI